MYDLARIPASDGHSVASLTEAQNTDELIRIILLEEGDTFIRRDNAYGTAPGNLFVENYVKISGKIVEEIEQIKQFLNTNEQKIIENFQARFPSMGQLTVEDLHRKYSRLFKFMETSIRIIKETLDQECDYIIVPEEEFDGLIFLLRNYYHDNISLYTNLINNTIFNHGSRVCVTLTDQVIISKAKEHATIRAASIQNHGYMSFRHISYQTGALANSLTGYDYEEVLKLPLFFKERVLDLETCSSVFNGDEVNRLSQDKHRQYVHSLLKNTQDYKDMFDYIFPLKRYMSMNTMFSTAILGGYNGLPTLLDSVKSSISYLSKVVSIPSTRQINEAVPFNPAEFRNVMLNNWPSHPQSSDCFEFPLPGAEFFKKFIEDLWKLIKQLPSILFRGVANQLDPAYKEMRQHYLNCNIKDLTWKGVSGQSFNHGLDKGLVNGVLYYDGKTDPDTGEGKNGGKYIPIIPAAIPDYLASTTHLIADLDPVPLGRTIIRTVNYAITGFSPFLDIGMAFSIPCAGIDKQWNINGKYDVGQLGRYGHPLSPFTILALSTPQLQSDRNLKRPNCVDNSGGRPTQARYDECDDIL